ncbi:MAG: TrkH family potassium uptake protein, partial [Mitsuokella sp.]
HLSSFQIITLSFIVLIGCGTGLLMLPIATQARISTDVLSALFTAVSASCVTGLVVVDTASHWSLFGQAVILLLIQIGGLGVITMAVAITVASGQKVGLMQRSTMQDALSLHQLGGIVRLLRFVLTFAAGIELCGTLLLFPVFFQDFGALGGLWMALFHAVSAFCNAGFDLMGTKGGGSLMAYVANPWVNVVIMALIVSGGLGFLTWADLHQNGLRIRRWRFQTKAILSMTAFLILFPAIIFYFGDMGFLADGRGLAAVFQAVTARTAGFNTIHIEDMTEAGKCMMVLLMFTGGAPGSTAGGIKTTTAFTLLVTALSILRYRLDIECFSRRISLETLQEAVAIFLLYAMLLFSSSIFFSYFDGAGMLDSLVETSSALGTVGLSIGLTERLSAPSKCLLMFLMYFGRVGALTLVYALHSKKSHLARRMPEGKLTIG